MSPVWVGFGVGCFLGGLCGVVVMCLCAVSGRAGRDMDQLIDVVPRNTRPPRLPRID